MKKPKKFRVVFRVDLTADAIKNLLAVTDRWGITQIAVTSNLVTWFDQQPDAVKAGILGHKIEGITDDPAVTFLKLTAKAK